MSSLVPSWMMRLRLSWERWRRTRLLLRKTRKLARLLRRQQTAIERQERFLSLLEQVQNPPQLVMVTEPEIPPEVEESLSEIPTLTPEEIEELKAMPMPDPVVTIEQELGLSTSPPSRTISPV